MTKRLKAAERRASILAVAKVLFADKGYHGVSVDEIAARLGVSPSILYQHFPSKEALYEAVLSRISEKRESYVNAVVDGPQGFVGVLRGMTHIFVSSVATDPDYLRMEMLSALEGADAAKHFFENRWRSFADYIEYNLKELAQSGQVDKMDPKVASLMFQGMVREALYNTCILKTERYSELELEPLVQQLIDLFLRAINYREQTADMPVAKSR